MKKADWSSIKEKMVFDECYDLVNYPHSLLTPRIRIFYCADSKSPKSRIQLPKLRAVTFRSAQIPFFGSHMLPLARRPPQLLRLKKQNRAMSQIKVDEVLCFCIAVSGLAHPARVLLGHTVCNEASKIPANDAMPRSPGTRVELIHLLSGSLLKYGPGMFQWRRRSVHGRTSFLMYCAMSFSTWNLAMASSATSTACRCISSL